MKGTGKSLLSLSVSSKLFHSAKQSTPLRPFSGFRLLSTSTASTATTATKTHERGRVPSKSMRDSMILEKFKLRQLKGSTTQTKLPPPAPTPPRSTVKKVSRSENVLQNGKSGSTEAVASFKELGLREEMIGAVEEMGIWVPTEIQCVGIPAVLNRESVVMSSDSDCGRTLAYLLPLVQLLRSDKALLSMKPKHPRAIVLCATEELSDQVFQVAKVISHYAQLKCPVESVSEQFKPTQDLSNDSIGMLVGTPSEVLQQMEEGDVFPDNIKYLVLDEVDTMFDSGFGPEIHKIISPIKKCVSKINHQVCQTVLVTTAVMKMLGEQPSPLTKCLEDDNSDEVAAMLLEIDQTEAFDLIESSDALKKKVAEAMDSLHSSSSGS